MDDKQNKRGPSKNLAEQLKAYGISMEPQIIDAEYDPATQYEPARNFGTKASDKDGNPLKMDEGKVDLSLVEPWLEEGLASIYELGLEKYHRDSWKKFSIGDARALIAPAKRHLNQYRKGEFIDPEDGKPHLLKAMWNLATIYYHEMKIRGIEI